MKVAMVRGVAFVQHNDGSWAPQDDDPYDVIADVAEALGFHTGEAYLDTLATRPAEIRQRLDRLA